MARTEQEIFDAILADKAADANLAGLTSTSNTALWRLWSWIVAKAIHIHEKVFDSHKTEIETLLAAGPPGTVGWYIKKIKEFQYGDSLVFVNDVPGYAVVDTTKQIIAAAALVEGGIDLLVKVAKSNGAGGYTALSGAELTAFETYLNAIKFAGTKTVTVSLNGDQLRPAGTFYYSALYTLTDVQADLDAQIAAYIASVPFNGRIYKQAVIDALQKTKGYVDLELTALETAPDGSATWTAMGRYVDPPSGYVNVPSAFSTILTFTPVV